MRKFKSNPGVAALIAMAALAGAQAAEAQAGAQGDPNCPPNPSWSNYREMRFTVQERPGRRPVLLAEGFVDANLIGRLEVALDSFRGDEIWLRSPGGDAQIAQSAGLLIRRRGLRTRVPVQWGCAGACNFIFYGGTERSVDAGGTFVVRMFTTVGDAEAIREEVARGDQRAADLLDEVAQRSRQVATGDIDYLIRMGVSRRLLSEIVFRQGARPHGPNRCLSRAEMRAYEVVTD